MINLFYINKKIINILHNKLKNYWIKKIKKYFILVMDKMLNKIL